MPIALPSNNIRVVAYTQAKDLPPAAMVTLKADQRNANIILPYILSEINAERQGRTSKENVWLVVSSYPNSRSDSVIDFIVAATNGALGKYPLFIYHARPFATLTAAFLEPRIKAITSTLSSCVPLSRVFSVFAVESVTRAFVSTWTKANGIKTADAHIKGASEYYAALLTPCDRRSFRNRSITMHPSLNFNIRRATREDIPIVAQLCYEFAAVSEPFTLSKEAAEKEATTYIEKSQMWVHEVIQQDGSGNTGIASICAVTRVSDAVAGITKVYTNPEYRRMGCAERLVRQVCRHYLHVEHKESLVLYVAHNNPGARAVYRRVGFQGLEDGSPAVAGVEPWLEIGFDRDAVELGHW